MSKILGNLHYALVLGLILLLIEIAALHGHAVTNPVWAQFFIMYIHVIIGVLWIGLLYYFNFVQTPTMPKIPAELKPGVSKYIAPAALFWFRWAALFTVLFGLLTAYVKDDIVLTLEVRPGFTTIGVGMWLAMFMAANVWFVIWPNQKKALGIVPADDATKANAARTGMIASRINTVLSIPMLYCMVMQGSSL